MNYTPHTAHSLHFHNFFLSSLLWFFMPFRRVQFLHGLKMMHLHESSEFELREKDNASSSRSSLPTKIVEEKMHHREMYPSKTKWLCYIAFRRRKINLCNLHLRFFLKKKKKKKEKQNENAWQSNAFRSPIERWHWKISWKQKGE